MKKWLMFAIVAMFVPLSAMAQSVTDLEQQAQGTKAVNHSLKVSKEKIALPPQFTDYDIGALIRAWDAMDIVQLKECGTRLNNMERMKNESIPGLTADDIFRHVLTLAADQQNEELIGQIASILDYWKDKSLDGKIQWARQYISENNMFQGGGGINPFTLSSQKRKMLDDLIGAINRARVCGKIDLLRQFDRALLADRDFRQVFNNDELRAIVEYVRHSEQFCNEVSEDERCFSEFLDTLSGHYNGHHPTDDDQPTDVFRGQPGLTSNTVGTPTSPEEDPGARLGRELADGLVNALNQATRDAQRPATPHYAPPLIRRQ